MVSDAEGQAAATASMDQSAFAHMERMLRDETKGEYTVGKMLGRGGMAVVYLAEETRLGRKVALKVLPPELTFGHGVDRFLREAKTAATLDHPSIIPIYRIASGGKLFWYAMKYLEGKSLEDVLRERGAYSLEETIELLEQVADALDYAHEHQVIHRDIKPANVMLDSRNRVIITDFGIAKALSEGALTASGSVIGTPYFMSPEQGMGKPVAGAADQYSVGVMAFRMLAGHVPFDGDSAIDILHKHCMMPAPRLEETAPHIPKHVCDAVEKALSKKADDRFTNIRQFVKAMKDPSMTFTRPSARTVVIDTDELAKVNSGPLPKVKAKPGSADKTVVAGSVPAAKASARPAVAAEPKSKLPLVAAVLLVLVGGGGFAAYSMMNKGTPTEPAPQLASATQGTAQTNPAPPTTQTQTPAIDTTPAVAQPVTPPVTPPATPPASKVASPPPRPRPQTQTAANPPANRPAQTNTPAPAPAAATGPGLLFLTLTTPGVVSIDGVQIGERSRLRETLSAGRHLIRVERDGFITKDTVLAVLGGDTLRVTLSLQARP